MVVHSLSRHVDDGHRSMLRSIEVSGDVPPPMYSALTVIISSGVADAVVMEPMHMASLHSVLRVRSYARCGSTILLGHADVNPYSSATHRRAGGRSNAIGSTVVMGK